MTKCWSKGGCDERGVSAKFSDETNLFCTIQRTKNNREINLLAGDRAERQTRSCLESLESVACEETAVNWTSTQFRVWIQTHSELASVLLSPRATHERKLPLALTGCWLNFHQMEIWNAFVSKQILHRPSANDFSNGCYRVDPESYFRMLAQLLIW